MKLPKWVLYGSAFGTFLGGGAILRERAFGEAPPNDDILKRAKGKVAVVTGANSGIGREISLGLAKNGARVIMACRDLTKCDKARREIILESHNRHVVCRKCDLGSYSSIKEFASRIKEEEPKLDILVNNAGVLGLPKSATSEGLETHFGVNYVGHFVLTAALMDKLKANPEPARIVNVCDSAAKQGTVNFVDLNRFQKYDAKDAYNQSKLAQVLFTLELREKLKGTHVTAVAAEAGGLVNTPLLRHFGIYSSFLAAIFVWPLAYPFLRTAQHGAATPLYAALCPVEDVSMAAYFRDKKPCTEVTAAVNVGDADRLWAITEKWTSTPFLLQ